MKFVSLFSIALLMGFSAQAEVSLKDYTKAGTFCADDAFRIKASNSSDTIPVEYQAAAAEAQTRATTLAEQEGITANSIDVRYTDPWKGPSANQYAGLHVSVADSDYAPQANAYEFYFRLEKDYQNKIHLSLLTAEDNWHSGGRYETVFICEYN